MSDVWISKHNNTLCSCPNCNGPISYWSVVFSCNLCLPGPVHVNVTVRTPNSQTKPSRGRRTKYEVSFVVPVKWSGRRRQRRRLILIPIPLPSASAKICRILLSSLTYEPQDFCLQLPKWTTDSASLTVIHVVETWESTQNRNFWKGCDLLTPNSWDFRMP